MTEYIKFKTDLNNINSNSNKELLEIYHKNVKNECQEMGQIKTEFDTQHFSFKEGPFLASNYHNVMRQMFFAMSESKRILLDIEELEIKLDENKSKLSRNINEYKKRKIVIKCKKLDLQIDNQKYELKSHLKKIEEFDKVRIELLRLNNNNPFTNEQFQKEQSEYYKWYLSKEMLHHLWSHRSGIPAGYFESLRTACNNTIVPTGLPGVKLGATINILGETLTPENILNLAENANYIDSKNKEIIIEQILSLHKNKIENINNTKNNSEIELKKIASNQIQESPNGISN